MTTITLNEIEGVQSYEFVVNGERRITLSISNENLSLQIPGGVDPKSIQNSDSSFFLRTKNSQEKHPL